MRDERRRRIRYAPFGQHTRLMLAAYIRHVVIVTAVLLAIALTIDLWPQYQSVASAEGGGGPVWNILRFCALRTPGLVAPFLPFSTFLGVVWSEVAHTRSGDRMLVWNSGRSPLQCLTPALLLGLILGTAEFAMDGFLGPASMGVQMQERFGLDGQRLDRNQVRQASWLSASGDLIRSEIEYGPPPVLHNLIVFKRADDGTLSAMLVAKTARYSTESGVWLLQDGEAWKAAEHNAAQKGDMVPFQEKSVALGVNPLWLSVYGMETQYIPLETLMALRPIDKRPDFKGSYRTRLQTIYGETLLPAGMALLAAALTMLLLAYDTSTPALVGIVFAGYIAHFGTKACLLLGQNGYMSPDLAGWLVPGVLLSATGVTVLISEYRRGAFSGG